MRLIVGLHNPETVYRGTRHNVGAEVVTGLAGRHGASVRSGPRRSGSRTARIVVDGEPALAALPRASMNVCGPAVRRTLDYFHVDPSDLLVVHDDIDLPFGRLRLRRGRGHGGHNGVRSVIGALATPGFWRLKVGLGRPPAGMDPADFVLARFSRAERGEVDSMVGDAVAVVEAFIADPERAVALAGARRPGGD